MLKDYFLKRKIKQALRQSQHVHTTLNYNEVRKVGVLVYLPDKQQHKHINKFVSELKKEGKEVVSLACFDSKAPEESFNFKFDYLSTDMISFFGNVESENVNNFIDTKFDYLYCICSDPEALGIQYVLANSKAKCRVGVYLKELTLFYEMMVTLKSGDGIEKAIRDMRKYTKAINKNVSAVA